MLFFCTFEIVLCLVQSKKTTNKKNNIFSCRSIKDKNVKVFNKQLKYIKSRQKITKKYFLSQPFKYLRTNYSLYTDICLGS